MNIDLGAVLASWTVQRGTVVLPKIVTLSRIEANFKLQELSSEVFRKIKRTGKTQAIQFPIQWRHLTHVSEPLVSRHISTNESPSRLSETRRIFVNTVHGYGVVACAVVVFRGARILDGYGSKKIGT